MIVCSDKVNQMRHLGFLKNKTDVLNHMSKHADLVKPKFEVACTIPKNPLPKEL